MEISGTFETAASFRADSRDSRWRNLNEGNRRIGVPQKHFKKEV